MADSELAIGPAPLLPVERGALVPVVELPDSVSRLLQGTKQPTVTDRTPRSWRAAVEASVVFGGGSERNATATANLFSALGRNIPRSL